MFLKVTRLTDDELATEYQKLRQGDEQAKHKIIENFIPLVLHMLKGRDDEELISNLLVDLLDAVTQIQRRPEETPNIGGYITIWIGGRIKRHHYNNRKRFIPYKLSKVPFRSELEVNEILEKFTPKQRQVVEGRMAGKSDEEIGQELGCTRQNVNLIRKEIKNAYRRMVR